MTHNSPTTLLRPVTAHIEPLSPHKDFLSVDWGAMVYGVIAFAKGTTSLSGNKKIALHFLLSFSVLNQSIQIADKNFYNKTSLRYQVSQLANV